MKSESNTMAYHLLVFLPERKEPRGRFPPPASGFFVSYDPLHLAIANPPPIIYICPAGPRGAAYLHRIEATNDDGKERPHGQTRIPVQTQGLHLPVQRDLRRFEQLLRLRYSWSRTQAQSQGLLVEIDDPGLRGHRRARLVHPYASPYLGGLGPRREFHRPAHRLQ